MGSKKQNESNGVAVQDGPQLVLAIDLDDIDSIPTSDESVTKDAPAQTSAPVADSEEAIIASVTTAGQAFAGDPLKDESLA